MPVAAPKPPTQRKRNRKRKRRAASSSSSSSSSEESSDDEAPTIKTVPVTKLVPAEQSSSSSEDSDSSSESSSSEEEAAAVQAPRGRQGEKDAQKPVRRLSPSPSPPPADLPSFLPSKDTAEESGLQEKELKDKFRQFWMASVADGFRDDLEEIRKEPNLGTSRLALLIDSLAAGTDVFTSSSNNTTINEMDVVLN